MNIFKLCALLMLDKSDFDKNLKDAEATASSVGSKIGSALKIGAGVTIGAITSSATAITALVKQSVSAYAETEQLVGGIKKLYGNMGQSLEEYAQSAGKSTDEVSAEWKKLEDAQNLVLDNAKNAYATAGMSYNTYMETATQFSASLISSLDGDSAKAGELTQTAMEAISDNWNTFGGDLDAITSAYKGFSKQNYTMLDNLKLGYGGTKTEMERLIQDANEYAQSLGQASDLSIDSFADIVQAIQLVQEEQNIAGTTSREATTTISGSLNMLKASWENLLSGFSDSDQDISQLVNNVVTSAGHVVSNVLPTVKQALNGISGAITNNLPSVLQTAFKTIGELSPQLISTAKDLLVEVGQALPSMFEELDLFNTLLNGIGDFREFSSSLFEMIGNGAKESLPQLIENFLSILSELTANLRVNLGLFVDSGIEMIENIWSGIVQSLPTLIENVPTIISNIANCINDNAPKILEMAWNMMTTLVQGLIEAIPIIVENIPQIFQAIVDVWSALNWLDLGKNLIEWIKNGLHGSKELLISKLKEIGENAKNKFKNIDWKSIGIDLVKGIWNGIKSMTSWLLNLVGGFASGILSKAKGVLGIHSPSTKMAWIGEMMMKGQAQGISDNAKLVINSAVKANKDILDALTPISSTSLDVRYNSIPTAEISSTNDLNGNNGYGNLYQTINVNQQISTADELAQTIRLESKYGLMKGVAIG